MSGRGKGGKGGKGRDSYHADLSRGKSGGYNATTDFHLDGEEAKEIMRVFDCNEAEIKMWDAFFTKSKAKIGKKWTGGADQITEMMRQCGVVKSNAVFKKIMNEAPTYVATKDSGATEEDFVRLMAKYNPRWEPKADIDAMVDGAFKKFDSGKADGKISEKEFMKIMTTAGESMTEAEVKACLKQFKEVDLNQDGVIDKHEFKKWLLGDAVQTVTVGPGMVENQKRERRKIEEKQSELV